MTSRFLPLIRSEDHVVPPIIIAPMVNQSELAFRLLCRRRSGSRLCFTPMTHARQFLESNKYRSEIFTSCAEDRPLVVQFCGNDPKVLLKAAKLVEDKCDGVDINLGCPQGIARKGKYGSFLLEHTSLLEEIMQTLSRNLTIPVSCKIRLVPGEIKHTIDLCTRLEAAGCEMITVHGRYREQNKHLVGACDWDAIKLVKESVKIPVLANGGISCKEDMIKCLDFTGVNGVMSCEAILENPALFGPNDKSLPDPFDISLEYLQLALEYPIGQPKPARAHLFKFLATTLVRHPDYYAKLGRAKNLLALKEVVNELKELHEGDAVVCQIKNCATFVGGPWYFRHRGTHSVKVRIDDDDGEEDEKGKKRAKQCEEC